MADPIKRTETAHVDLVTRTATSSVQWFLEKRNTPGNRTHPITRNNRLTFFICGEEAFRDIACEIAKARQSIDLCCWGFDPGMELKRIPGRRWPRGETFGDLLLDAAARGVIVRLLVWYDSAGSRAMLNMPGHSHGLEPWLKQRFGDEPFRAEQSLKMAQLFNREPKVFKTRHADRYEIDDDAFPATPRELSLLARGEYCFNWYRAAIGDFIPNLHVGLRGGSSAHIGKMLDAEAIQATSIAEGSIERELMVLGGAHHQKPILIDYAFEGGRKAVGYVMGFNSVTDYWDTRAHLVDDPRREDGGERESDECVQGMEAPGYKTLKPYHDYACRIDQGGALMSLYKNFQSAWTRVKPNWPGTVAPIPHLLRPAEAGCSTVQIVRTQPEEGDQTIKELYFNAVDKAAAGLGYLYIENQYFQYEEFCKRLISVRKRVVSDWKAASAKAGRKPEDMPMLRVFIVIPVPERGQMVPRTYDALAALGQQHAMTGQQKLVDQVNKIRKAGGMFANASILYAAAKNVVNHANTIHKPSLDELKEQFGLQICVAMLSSCEFVNGKWCYREIYNHSKLLIVDDSFVTVGSANLNQRSMAGDSEINMATDDRSLAVTLRKQIWSMHSGSLVDGKAGTRGDIEEAFFNWRGLMRMNRAKMTDKNLLEEKKRLTGFLLPLEDGRSSSVRFA